MMAPEFQSRFHWHLEAVIVWSPWSNRLIACPSTNRFPLCMFGLLAQGETRAFMDSRRITGIDGLRTIAILAVVAFHYCYHWGPPLNSENLYPYGAALAGLPGVRFGGYGVHLFFTISGFVIAMTLDRCKTPREFVVRRYARLAPAMLLFSSVTFAAMHVIPHAPFPERGAWFLSSITFIDPVYLNRIAPNIGFQSIDGVYWSLYREVQFYALACLVYFTSGNWFRVMMGLLSATACGLLLVRIPLISPLSNNLLIPSFLPWFVTGIGFHALALRAEWRVGAFLISLGTLELLAQSAAGAPDAAPIGVVVLVPILFAAAIWFRPVVSVLSSKPMVMMGVASYGLYLIHENVGIAILHSLPPMDVPGGAIAALAVAAGCTAVAVASFRWIEEPVSRAIRARFLPTRTTRTTRMHARRDTDEYKRARGAIEGRLELPSRPAVSRLLPQ
jgi:peptidoglycan/LPS O-acetylase OafA/YrhL